MFAKDTPVFIFTFCFVAWYGITLKNPVVISLVHHSHLLGCVQVPTSAAVLSVSISVVPQCC